MSTRQRGFTLIELAIVLSLLGLLFTLLTPWRSYWQYQKYREAERGLEAAIAEGTVTYDFARLMNKPNEVSCSGFAKRMVELMD